MITNRTVKSYRECKYVYHLRGTEAECKIRKTSSAFEFINNLLLSVCKITCPMLRRIKAKEVGYPYGNCSKMLIEWKERNRGTDEGKE